MVSNSAQNLEEALARMAFEVLPGPFFLAGFPEPPTPEDLALVGEGPGQVLREGGETTVLAPAAGLAALLARRPAAEVERDLVWIRFTAPMGWELVGFLALVCGKLSAAGVPLGAVCGYSRDHLFVARRHLEKTQAVLASLFEPGTTSA